MQNDLYVRVLPEGGTARFESSEWIPLTHSVPGALVICERCGSLMKHEEVLSRYEPYSTWRCLLCGEYSDEVILGNRKRQANSQIDDPPKENTDTSPESHLSLER